MHDSFPDIKEGKEFFAFISYKREDEKWAKWLQRKLETFKLPSHLKDRDDLPKEIRPIFKDTMELIPGTLPKQIVEALEHSKFLIVICSPRSASSTWVNAEIEAFITMGRTDRIIPFIIEGAPFNPQQECYPQALRDLRKDQEILGTSIHEMGKEAAMVKVVSRMFGLRFDVLWRRHERYLRRRRALIIGLILAALLAAAAFLSIISRQHAQLKETNWDVLRNESLMMAEKAERLVDEGDSFAAVRLALDALPKDLTNPERPYTIEAEAALRKGLEGNAIIRDEWGFLSVAISPDGKLIASVSDKQYSPLKLWNASSGKLISIPGTVDEFSNRVVFSPDGKSLIATGLFVQIWDLEYVEDAPRISMPSDVFDIRDMATSPDGKSIAIVDEDSLYIVHSDSCRAIKTLHHPGGEVHSVAFSPDGNRIVSCSERNVIVWHTRNWNALRIWEKEGAVCAVFSPDGENIAVGMEDNSVRICNADSGQELFIIQPGSSSVDPVISIAFSPDGTGLAFCSGKDIYLWRPDGESQVFTGHSAIINKVTFSPDGHRIVSASDDKTIRIWNASSGQRIRMLTEEPRWTAEHTNKTHSIAFSRDGRNVIAGIGDHLVQWDVESGKQLTSFTGHSDAVLSFVISPDGNKLFSISEDGFLRSWDTISGEGIGSPIGIDGVIDVGYSIEKKAIVTITQDESISLWNPESGIEIENDLLGCMCSITSMAVSNDGTHILIGTVEGGFRQDLMDLDRGFFHFLSKNEDLVPSFYRHFPVHTVALSPDGEKAATDGIIWDIKDDAHGSILFTLDDMNSITAIAFSPDGKRIVTGDDGHLVRIWDAETGKEIVSYRGHWFPVTAVAFSPDGGQIVSESADKDVFVWSYSPLQDLIDDARTAIDDHQLYDEMIKNGDQFEF